jgi:hypothetical protein
MTDYRIFRDEAERLFREEWFLDLNSEVDEDRIRSAFADEDTPREFVERYAEKYGLFDFLDPVERAQRILAERQL